MRLTSLRPILILALSALLAGCYVSKEPKFPLSTAVAVFGEGGRFDTFDAEPDGSFKKGTTVLTLRKRPDSAYDYTEEKGDTKEKGDIDEKGDTSMASFHQLRDDLYVVQNKLKGEWGYAIVRVSGNEAVFHFAPCDRQDKATVERLGAVFRGEYECLIDGVKDPAAFFTALDLGKPNTKMARQ